MRVTKFLILALCELVLAACNSNSSQNAQSSGTVIIVNLHNKQKVETGFIIGTSTEADSVGCQYDGGTVVEATGTTTWICELPKGTSTWRLGSSHTVRVGVNNSGTLANATTLTVTKGNNKDINGDGYPDLAVGAYRYNSDDGGIFLYYGSATGIPQSTASATPTLIGKPASGEGLGGGYFGMVLDDFNGDGYGDLAAGASSYNSYDGATHLFYGSSTGIAPQTAGVPTLIGKPGTASYFGYTLSAGDINGDVYSDLVVAPYQWNNGSNYDGGVYIYYGSSSGIASATAGTPTLIGKAGSVEWLGYSGMSAGDVNGDGYIDLIAAGTNYNSGDGGVHIFYGSGSGIASATAGVPTLVGKASSAGYFGSVISVGDMNGDGYEDLAIGAPYFSSNDGAAYIYYGSSTGIAASTAGTPTIAGPPYGAYFASSGILLEDFNSDSYADLIVTYDHSNWQNPGVADGALYFYAGDSTIQTSIAYGTALITGYTNAGYWFGSCINQ